LVVFKKKFFGGLKSRQQHQPLRAKKPSYG